MGGFFIFERAAGAMSAIGTKRTWPSALHVSAFGGKADMPFALQMSAFDPKRTCTALELTYYSRGNIVETSH